MHPANKKQRTELEKDLKTLNINEIISMAVERKLPGWEFKTSGRSNGYYFKQDPTNVTFGSQLVPYLKTHLTKFGEYTKLTHDEINSTIHSSKEIEKKLLLECKDLSFVVYFLYDKDNEEKKTKLKLLRSKKSKQRIASAISPEGGNWCLNQLLALYTSTDIKSVYVVSGEETNIFHVIFESSIEKTYKLDFFDSEDLKRMFFQSLRWCADFELEELDWDVDWSPSMKKKPGTKRYIYGDLIEEEECASEEEEEKE